MGTTARQRSCGQNLQWLWFKLPVLGLAASLCCAGVPAPRACGEEAEKPVPAAAPAAKDLVPPAAAAAPVATAPATTAPTTTTAAGPGQTPAAAKPADAPAAAKAPA